MGAEEIPLMAAKFSVVGSPAPQGSKKIAGNWRAGARPVLVESSKKSLQPWRQDVKAAAEAARGPFLPMDGPLVARIVFTLPKPTTAPKKRRTWPCKKPDLDKLLRSTLDALKTAGLIADDARIVEFDRLAKVYPGEDPEALDVPGARIEVRRLLP